MKTTITVLLMLLTAPAFAQAPPKNPSQAIFTCSADHDQHTAHELDILRSDGTVLQTLLLGTAQPSTNGDVTLSFNVQPIAFGSYTVRMRSLVGAVKSADSEPSNVWERAPGSPSKPRVQ